LAVRPALLFCLPEGREVILTLAVTPDHDRSHGRPEEILNDDADGVRDSPKSGVDNLLGDGDGRRGKRARYAPNEQEYHLLCLSLKEGKRCKKSIPQLLLYPPRLARATLPGLITEGSTLTFTQAVFPEAKAASSAGRISSGFSTKIPKPPRVSTILW